MGKDVGKYELKFRLIEAANCLSIVDGLIDEFDEDDDSTYNTHERHVYLSALADVKHELLFRLNQLEELRDLVVEESDSEGV